jgi:hypothetical protein
MNPIEEKHWKAIQNLKYDVKAHANITKDTAVGFYEWCKDNEFYECTRQQRDIPTSELYDIYLESLKS